MNEKIKCYQKQIELFALEKSLTEAAYREKLSSKEEEIQELISQRPAFNLNDLNYKELYQNCSNEVIFIKIYVKYDFFDKFEAFKLDSSKNTEELQRNLNELKKKIASSNIGQFFDRKNETKIIELTEQIAKSNELISHLKETISNKESTIEEVLNEKQRLSMQNEALTKESLKLKEIIEDSTQKSLQLENFSNENVVKLEKYEKALLRINQEKTNLKKVNEEMRENIEKIQVIIRFYSLYPINYRKNMRKSIRRS